MGKRSLYNSKSSDIYIDAGTNTLRAKNVRTVPGKHTGDKSKFVQLSLFDTGLNSADASSDEAPPPGVVPPPGSGGRV